MNIEQLLKLIEAGYTKADIEAMAKGTPAEESADTSSEESTDTSSEESTSNDEANNQFATLSQELENIKKLLQGINIKTKGSDEKPNKDTASDMLAKLIDPKLNDGGISNEC